jgi:hypothetical protein
MSAIAIPTPRLGLLAAQQATAASAELLRFAADQNTIELLGQETVELLADALKLALELTRELGEPDPDGDRGQLLAACVKFLDGWVG